jgi:hypothetical protein
METRLRRSSRLAQAASAAPASISGRDRDHSVCSASGSVPNRPACDASDTNHGRPRARRYRRCLPLTRCLWTEEPPVQPRQTRGRTATQLPPGRADVGSSPRVPISLVLASRDVKLRIATGDKLSHPCNGHQRRMESADCPLSCSRWCPRRASDGVASEGWRSAHIHRLAWRKAKPAVVIANAHKPASGTTARHTLIATRCVYDRGERGPESQIAGHAQTDDCKRRPDVVLRLSTPCCGGQRCATVIRRSGRYQSRAPFRVPPEAAQRMLSACRA